MKPPRMLLAIMLTVGLAAQADRAKAVQATSVIREGPSSDSNSVMLDLMTGFSNSLAARDRRLAIDSARFARTVASLRAEQRRLKAGNRAAAASIAELEGELASLAWVKDPRFRGAMIAYRNLIAAALRAASPELAEGLRLLAAGQSAEGLDILRKDARSAAVVDRESGERMHAAVDTIVREAGADRLRLIAVEAWKSVEARKLPVEIAIADWLNVVATGDSNRGDHLILSYLYYLDGNEPEADSQRQIAAARPDPPERLSSALDELFGAPADLVFQILAIGSNVPDRLAAMQAPTEQMIARRADLSPALRREYLQLFGAMHECTRSFDNSQDSEDSDDPDAPILSDGGKSCLALISRAAELSLRRIPAGARRPSPRLAASVFGTDWGGSNLAEAAALYADVITAALIEIWSDPDLTRGASEAPPAAGSSAAAEAPWPELAAAIQSIAATCARVRDDNIMMLPQVCARASIYRILVQYAEGTRPPRSALSSAVTGLVAALGRGPGTAFASGNIIQSQVDLINRMVAESVARIDRKEGLRIASALLEKDLAAHRSEHPAALDDFILLVSLGWYESFQRNGEDVDPPRLHPTSELSAMFLRLLDRRPTFGPSCYALLEFADAIMASRTPLTGEDLGRLQLFFRPAERCGLAHPAPTADSSSDSVERPKSLPFRTMLRLYYSGGAETRLARGDIASARALANLISFGDPADPPEGAVLPERDAVSFANYAKLAMFLADQDALPDAIRFQTILFDSAAAMAAADFRFRPCEICPEGEWRPPLGTIGRQLGMLLEADGKEQRAAEVYRTMIGLGERAESGLLMANFKLARFALKKRDFEAALPHLRTVVDRLRRQPPATRLAADAAAAYTPPTPLERQTGPDETRAFIEEMRSLQQWATGAGLGLRELMLRDLIGALHMTRRHAETLPLHTELIANLLALVDRGESNSELPGIMLFDGQRRCGALAMVRGKAAGLRCELELAFELARRSSRPGMGNALRSASISLRPKLVNKRDRRRGCATLAGFPDAAARARTAGEIGLACR